MESQTFTLETATAAVIDLAVLFVGLTAIAVLLLKGLIEIARGAVRQPQLLPHQVPAKPPVSKGQIVAEMNNGLKAGREAIDLLALSPDVKEGLKAQIEEKMADAISRVMLG